MRDQKVLSINKCSGMLAGLFVIVALITSAPAIAQEADAKSIPKPILMLGLFCNSALSSLKTHFEVQPGAPPWLATGSKLESIKILMNKLDTTDGPYEKAIRDHAISADEAKFIKFSAIHESEQWLINITSSCVSTNLSTQDYEACLKETNSEVYKCYRIIIDAVQAMAKSSPAK